MEYLKQLERSEQTLSTLGLQKMIDMPAPADFDLAETDISNIRQKISNYQSSSEKSIKSVRKISVIVSYLLYGVGLFGIVYMHLPLDSYKIENTVVILIMYIVMYLIIIAFTIEHIENIIESFLEKRTDVKIKSIPGYYQYQQYSSALNDYEREVKARKERKAKLAEIKNIKDAKKQRLERRKKKDFWTSLDGFIFEKEIAKVFDQLGYQVSLTKGTGDSGVDIFLDNNTIVQCKASIAPISPAIVRDVYGTMVHFNASKGIVISTGGFTSGCYDFCRGKDIELWDLDKLINFAQEL